MKLFGGTIVDALLMAAPPSTRTKSVAAIPRCAQSKKGNEWHLGMKLHIGDGHQTGPVRNAGVTSGNVPDGG